VKSTIIKRIAFAVQWTPPPNLYGKAIKSLCIDFCKILAAKLTNEGLRRKPLAKKSVGAAHVGCTQKKESKPNEDKSSKKSRKE
jgi:hypothetical protein